MSQLLQNAVYGGIMILAAAALRRGLKDKLIPEARLALWAVCLFRLLTPAAPSSVLSLWRLGRFFAPETQSAPVPVPGVPAAAPALAVGTMPDPAAAPAQAAGTGAPWGAVLAAIWVIAGAVLAARFALAYARTRRAVGRTILLGRNDPRYAALPKCARLREGPMDGAPLTFGVVRPTVVLSPGLEGAELACVLAHEGVHARRRDNLWHYVTALALIVHWWNPAVWLMARLLRRDVELACDRAAVKKLGAEKRAEYANALISMATQGKDPAFCQTFGRKAAEERIISIMKYKKTTIIGGVLTLALVLAVTVGFASNPAADVPLEESDPAATDPATAESGNISPANETVVYQGRTYNRADLSQETLDWLDWYLSLSEEGQMSVSMVPPELIDSMEVSAGEAEAGSTDDAARYICTRADCGNNSVHTHDGVTYKGWTNKHALPPFCTDESCAVSGVHYHENGEVIHCCDTLPAEFPVCPVEGCTTPGTHTHDGFTVYACNGAHCGGVCDGSCLVYFDGEHHVENDHQEVPIGEQGFTHDPQTEDSAGAGDEPIACPPEAIDKTAPFGPHTCADCGVEGCTVDYLHMHSGIFTFTMGPVCPREDCSLWGCHEHDGVMYSCNGGDGTYHQNGVCDGSCYVHSTPAYYELNGIDTTQSAGQSPSSGQSSGYGQSQGNGHHSESHSSGHHGNHH